MKRFSEYLLTDHPLLWNTRAVWVLAANAVIHLLFFLSGLASVSVKTLVDYSSAGRVGGEGMYTFSVLAALVVLIVWCVYYLRNNAFKSFYRLSEFYLAKEFGLIFLIVLSSICYSLSFQWGVKLRVRSITSEKEMVQEMDAVNAGMVYVPVEKNAYFLLNSCEEKQFNEMDGNDAVALPDVDENYNGRDSVRVRRALQQPNAYSYANYCSRTLSYSNYALLNRADISHRNRQWLTQGRRDSVAQTLKALFVTLDKYGVEYRLNADTLACAVFATPYFNIQSVMPQQRFEYRYGTEVENPFYLNAYNVERLFRFIEDCQPNTDNAGELKTVWNVAAYIALSLSILLLCYRRFPKKVFLISVIGTLVWAILIGLMVMGSGKNGFAVILLLLCAGFLALALGFLAQRNNKTSTGVLLNWHAYLIPFAVMLVVLLIDDYHGHQQYNPLAGYSYTDEQMRRLYPFSTWVVNHTADIFLGNTLAVAAYVAFVFNALAKRWQLLPQE